MFFWKISENPFFKDIKLYLKFIQVNMNFRNSFQIFFWKKYFLKYVIQCKHIDWNEIYVK